MGEVVQHNALLALSLESCSETNKKSAQHLLSLQAALADLSNKETGAELLARQLQLEQAKADRSSIANRKHDLQQKLVKVKCENSKLDQTAQSMSSTLAALHITLDSRKSQAHNAEYKLLKYAKCLECDQKAVS